MSTQSMQIRRFVNPVTDPVTNDPYLNVRSEETDLPRIDAPSYDNFSHDCDRNEHLLRDLFEDPDIS